ncbi:MAG: hypothetical protein ABII64_02720 [Elusimicrobiota bacterium]
MKRKHFKITIDVLRKAGLCLLLASVFGLPSAFAAFKDPGFLARPIGMGGAFTAICDDANSVWYNPAGIANLERNSILLTYSKPYLDLSGVNMSMSFATYVMPLRKAGALAATYSLFNTVDLYQESTVMLTYAYDFKFMNAGLNLKSLGRAVTLDIRTIDDPVFANGNSKSAFAADIGLYKKWSEEIFTGLCVKNLNQPDVGYEAVDPVPMESRIGVAGSFKMDNPADILLMDLDLAVRNNDSNVYLGGEIWFMDYTMAGRLGANKNEFSLGFSYIFNIGRTDIYGNPLYAIDTHYSFSMPFYVEGTSGSHRISLGFQF